MPMMTCPSGLEAEVRKIRGDELVALAEQADSDTADVTSFATMIGGCWLRTTHPGPYPFTHADTKPDFARLLKGDLLFAFVFLRRISHPDKDRYYFPVQCQQCAKRYEWGIDLAKDLEVKVLGSGSVKTLKEDGGIFSTALVDGRGVRFQLQTIAQEDPINRLMKQQKRENATIIDSIVAQITSIDGVKGGVPAVWKAISSLDLDELYALRQAFDEVDCGLETGIQTRCTNRKCRWDQDINLPLGRSFFALRRLAKSVTIDSDDQDTPSSAELFSDTTSSGSAPSSMSFSGDLTLVTDTPSLAKTSSG